MTRRQASGSGIQGNTSKDMDSSAEAPSPKPEASKEIGGPKGPEPTRYGDWEINGKCVDF